jgi:hypothetical protein
MIIKKRIEQSRVRVQSGLRLIAFLLLVAAVGFLLDVSWLAKLGIALTGFFVLVTLLEYWNVHRLKGKTGAGTD